MAQTKKSSRKKQVKPVKPARKSRLDEKQKSAKKVVRTKRKPSTVIKPEMVEDMFLEYCRTHCVRSVAKKFKLAESTVHKLKKKQNWDRDFEKVLDRARDRTIKKAAGMAVKNIRVATALRDKVATALLKDEIEPNVGDFVKIATYVDNLEGIDNDRERGEAIINIINGVDQATFSEKQQLIGNCLAGFGIDDPAAVDKLSEVCFSGLSSQDRTKS